MRASLATSLLFAFSASAATLQVEVNRNGFAGPIEVALAPRVEARPPQWSAMKMLASGQSTLQFSDVAPGLYVVLARGPEPLQRLGAKANVGAAGSTVRLTIPRFRTALRVTLGGEPLARATVTLRHDELQWTTGLTTGEDGRFAGALWQPSLYGASVRPAAGVGPHVVDVQFGTAPVTIDVPDRHVTGRVLDEDGKPLGGALVILHTENSVGTLTISTASTPDGAFAFFGVREGTQSLTARAPSYLNSDAVAFDLRGPSGRRTSDLRLLRGTQRSVRVIDERGDAVANATLYTGCDGHVKSTSVTDAEGRSNVAIPERGSCSIYTLPTEGSIAIARVNGAQNLTIRVPAGNSSLKLALKSENGDAFADVWLLMRIDGMVVPPAIARQFLRSGLSLITNDEGRISLARIPPGTYEFWPYRTLAEGQTLYETASDFAAPISVNVLRGENDATIRLRAR